MSENQREVFIINDNDELADIVYEEKEYKKVNDKTSVNLEKGYEDHLCVVERRSDGRFFRIVYTDGPDGIEDYNRFPIKAKEVFPKPVTKIEYD